MSKNAGIVLEFNGHKYDLQKLLHVAASAPRIEIEGFVFNNDISKHDEEISEQFKVSYHNGVPPEAKEMIVFKQEGNYTILFGHDLLAEEELTKPRLSKARLISTPALKKARFEKDEPATPERVQSSTAVGDMADKMQHAFSNSRPVVKQERYETQQRREAPVRNHGGYENRKVQNSTAFGAHASSAPAQTTPRPAGYSDMTTHQSTGPASDAKSRHNGGPRQFGGRRPDKT